jgi:hypothetical protein
MTIAPNSSIFDPVLAELAYRWWCPLGGTILDPFAGGSVRGIVAAKVGRQYVGGELRSEQVEANIKQANEIIKEDIKIAEQIKAEYVGFATVDNYFFNAKKYKPVGYVISKAVAIKYDGLRYDKNLEAMEDFGYCAEQLIKNNCVLINSWIKPVAGHYEQGGIGTYEQRVPRKVKDCEYLMRKYPNFFRYKVKKDCHPRAELQIRFNNPNQIINWKNENR